VSIFQVYLKKISIAKSANELLGKDGQQRVGLQFDPKFLVPDDIPSGCKTLFKFFGFVSLSASPSLFYLTFNILIAMV
jgi:hypothetical protein